MKIRLRRSIVGLLGALALLSSVPTSAASYPERPIKLVVPFPPGATTDVVGRAIAQWLSASLGQQVVVENRAGAAATIGTQFVATSPPDGYTLLLGISSSMVVAPVFTKVPYDPVKDFAPISIVTSAPFGLVVHPSVPAKNTAELIALAKARPGALNMASSGDGSSAHLTGELFKSMAGINMTHVPYKGGAPAMTDLIGGQVEVLFDVVSATLPHVASGKVRALGVSSTERLAASPDIPTIAETVPGYESSAWFGIPAPAGTPPEIVSRLNRELVDAVSRPENQKFLTERGLQPIGTTPERFADQIRNDLVKWGKVVKEATAKR